MKREIKTVYFFAKVAIDGEQVTDATRFIYFLVDVLGNMNSYEPEMRANKKIYKIAALLSQRNKRKYKVVKIERLSDTKFNELKEHYPVYKLYGKTLVLPDTVDDINKQEYDQKL